MSERLQFSDSQDHEARCHSASLSRPLQRSSELLRVGRSCSELVGVGGSWSELVGVR